MKEWKMKDSSLTTVEEFILKNCFKGYAVYADPKRYLADLLNPRPNPFIKDMDKAVAFAKESIAKGNKVSIVGDYDCDGVMGVAILEMAIEKYTGSKPYVRIPKRRAEGYGLKENIIDEIDSGLLITVDNGIAAAGAIQKAKDKGLDVIVLDHHEIRGDGMLPNADVLVDPSAIEGSEFNYYCGAALAYRFAKELIPNETKLLEKLLVFASIATVADVMELVGDNRNIVTEGLRLLNDGCITQGFNTLLSVARIEHADEDTYGFKLGPIVNASGRLYDHGPDEVVELITNDCDIFDDEQMAKNEEIAKILIKRNEQRQALVKKQMATANAIIEENHMENDSVIVVFHESFDEGIVGILAGQLAEDYRRPAIVFTNAKDEGMLKGSGRTYSTINLKALLDTAIDLYARPNGKDPAYGGHAGAAGMTVPAIVLNAFKQRLCDNLGKMPEMASIDNFDGHYYDIEIKESEISQTTLEVLKYAPYGQGNPRPVFKISDFSLSPNGKDFVRVIGKDKNHLKFFGKYAEGVGFDMVSAYEEEGKPKHMEVLGNLSQNHFMGKVSSQVEFIDFHPLNVETKSETKRTLEDLLIF